MEKDNIKDESSGNIIQTVKKAGELDEDVHTKSKLISEFGELSEMLHKHEQNKKLYKFLFGTLITCVI